MKNFFTAALIACLAIGAQAQVSTDAQLEQLGRGVIALPAQSGGIFVSWRFLGTDSESIETITTGTIIHDLFGRCVYNPSNGIYIVNGRKVHIQ